MGQRKATREDYTEVESVVPTREERETTYSLYSFLINAEENQKDFNRRKDARYNIAIWEAIKSGKFESASEAVDYVDSERKGKPLYSNLADSPEEAIDYLKDVVLRRAKGFIESREETLRTSFCTRYLAPLVLAGMRGGFLLCTWWRAVCYGFSVEPCSSSKEKGKEPAYNAFPYRSLDDMTPDDRRAFLWTVEDVYYSMESLSLLPQLDKKVVDVEELERDGRYFVPYPKDGYTKEEIAARHSDKEQKVEVEDLYNSWEYEMELYFPIAIHRQDEAIYYALKYCGAEYLEYVKSLNVVEDFDYGTESETLLYNNIMKEGYVWHSDK